MVYIPFNPDVPEGADTPPIYADDDLANIRALRDAVVCGFMPGWSYALDTANPPLFSVWTKGLIKFRMTLTYGPGTPSYSNSAFWEYSDDGGALWAPITTGGTPVAITTNAVGSILTVDKDAGMWVLALSAFNRNRYSEYAGDAHAALTGIAVHGLGTMSTQDSDAVFVTGGDVQGVRANFLERLTPNWPPDLNGSGTWDWAATPTMGQSPAGWVCTTISNPQPGEMKRIHVYTAGAITLPSPTPVIWAQGHPVWGTTGTMVNLVALNGGGILATTIPF